jgi:hypothetical protein
MFFDEVTFGHDLKASGILKSLDTEKTFRVNPKFVSAYHAPNRALKIYASNNPAALPIDHDDRRKLILDVSTARKEDTAYFEGLRAAFAGGELAAFLHDALQADLKGFDRRKVYKTGARSDLADMTASPEMAFVVLMLDNGSLSGGEWVRKPGTSGWMAANGERWPFEEVAVPPGALYNDYLNWIASQRGERSRSQAELYRQFKKALGDRFTKERIRKPDDPAKREWRYRFAPLDECRAGFDDHCGRRREWAEPASASLSGQRFPEQKDAAEEEV